MIDVLLTIFADLMGEDSEMQRAIDAVDSYDEQPGESDSGESFQSLNLRISLILTAGMSNGVAFPGHGETTAQETPKAALTARKTAQLSPGGKSSKSRKSFFGIEC